MNEEASKILSRRPAKKGREEDYLGEARRKLRMHSAVDNDTRLDIMIALSRHSDMSFNDIIRAVSLGGKKIEGGLLTYHLAVLSHAGLVEKTSLVRGKKTTCYRPTGEAIQLLRELNLIPSDNRQLSQVDQEISPMMRAMASLADTGQTAHADVEPSDRKTRTTESR